MIGPDRMLLSWSSNFFAATYIPSRSGPSTAPIRLRSVASVETYWIVRFFTRPKAGAGDLPGVGPLKYKTRPPARSPEINDEENIYSDVFDADEAEYILAAMALQTPASIAATALSFVLVDSTEKRKRCSQPT